MVHVSGDTKLRGHQFQHCCHFEAPRKTRPYLCFGCVHKANGLRVRLFAAMAVSTSVINLKFARLPSVGLCQRQHVPVLGFRHVSRRSLVQPAAEPSCHLYCQAKTARYSSDKPQGVLPFFVALMTSHLFGERCADKLV